jgi:hypothetical protein
LTASTASTVIIATLDELITDEGELGCGYALTPNPEDVGRELVSPLVEELLKQQES